MAPSASLLVAFYAIICLISYSTAFHINSMNRLQRTGFSLNARVRRTRSSADNNLPVTPDYTVGENVPSEIARNNAIYDMILVERFSQPEKTEVGLFLPKVEGKDEKHMGKILSMPAYGLESEQGRVATPSEIAPYNVGDIVYIRDPWGVGPKDIEVGPRCFSFHKALHITGVVR